MIFTDIHENNTAIKVSGAKVIDPLEAGYRRICQEVIVQAMADAIGIKQRKMKMVKNLTIADVVKIRVNYEKYIKAKSAMTFFTGKDKEWFYLLCEIASFPEKRIISFIEKYNIVRIYEKEQKEKGKE